MSDETQYRIEHDTMGEVRVPAGAKYRAQTQRAVDNFKISGQGLSRHHIAAIAQVKKGCAQANAELGYITRDQEAAIIAAADLVIAGGYDNQFPIDVFQTGSGTSSNMNMNEVLSTLAAEAGTVVHPNDHVNASQSSNDTFPSSIHIATVDAVTNALLPGLEVLATSLEAKATEFADVVKPGRTHLMDATPVTLGQEFSGYAQQIRNGIARVESAMPRVAQLPLGGTAVGTGINSPIGYRERVIAIIAENTGLPFTEAPNHFEAQAAQDAFVELSGQLRTIAVSLTKICNDIRWMGSGPRTGLGEIHLPDLQPGSSIMPGKVNPVVPEAVLMVCAQVIGNDAAIAYGGASGSFELNVMLPMIARNILESVNLLANSVTTLALKTIDGIEANRERARELAESSPAIVTPLNRIIGYEASAGIAKHSLANNITIRQAVEDLGYVERGEITSEQLDVALDVMSMTHP